MTISFDIWKMLAGVAFFLLAMGFMEETLRVLAGRKFKLFLKKHTKSKLKAIGGGAVVTGLLQSSSVVNLLILSMVGAGVVKLENALALILGSNLGSTFNSWIIVTLGFNYNIENYILPVAGFTGILMAFIKTTSKWFLWCKFLFSMAFLFIGLGYIKTGMEGLVKQTDLTFFNNYPLIIFLLVGIVLTFIVQSSSVTMAITLSALNVNAITLVTAMAMVLGSEIGTTLKLFLASVKGVAIKKQVALGNFIFNVITALLLFFLIGQVNQLITGVFNITDNNIALVFFQSFINVISALIFFRFLKLISAFLISRYKNKEDESFFISKVPVTDSELAIIALENETKRFINLVIQYSLDAFYIKKISADVNLYPVNHFSKTLTEKYDFIKHLHGDIHGFCLKCQNTGLNKSEAERLNQVIAAIRNIMYAAKNIRDTEQDINLMRNSSNETKYNFFNQSTNIVLDFYEKVNHILNAENKANCFKELTLLYQSTISGYIQKLQLLYKQNLALQVNEIEISTLINFNREIFTSFKSMLFGIKDFLLTPKEAEYFDTLPGFIR